MTADVTGGPLRLIDIDAAPTLIDPELQAAFEDVGYVVVDLLGRDAVDDLLAVARELHPAPPPGRTWDCDFYSDDLAVKRRVAEAIGSAVAAPIDRHLVDHEAYIMNFVVNWPGDGGGQELHQHASVTDERDHRGVVVWLALSETTLANGTLNVVPKSHRVLRYHKAQRTPGWFEHVHDHLLDHHLEAVTLQPGQALVLDNAVLHNSFLNMTSDPRITAVLAVAPRRVPLRYYDDAGDGLVKTYELSPDFFLDVVAGTQGEWAQPDGLEPVGVEQVSVRRLTADECADLLPSGDAGAVARRIGARV